MNEKEVVLAYHQVSNRFFPGINNIKVSHFWSIIELLAGWGLEFQDKTIPENKPKPVFCRMTFDDGYEEHYELVLRLLEKNIVPIVFIPTDYIGQINSWDYSGRSFPARHLDAIQIRHLSDNGAVIGSHGKSHRALTTLTENVNREELADSRKRLEDITGKQVNVISFPFGRTNSSINRLAQGCGYLQGYSLGRQIYSEGTDDFIVQRVPVYGLDDYYSLYYKVVRGSVCERLKSDIINRLAGGTIIISTKLK